MSCAQYGAVLSWMMIQLKYISHILFFKFLSFSLFFMLELLNRFANVTLWYHKFNYFSLYRISVLNYRKNYRTCLSNAITYRLRILTHIAWRIRYQKSSKFLHYRYGIILQFFYYEIRGC